MIQQTIVAEISKTWPESSQGFLLCQKFEEVIEVNRKRGYRLMDWKFSQVPNNNQGMIETIIAIFEKE